MTKSTATQLAEHEIRISSIEKLLPKIDHSLEAINRKLDDNYISRREYDKRIKDQELYNQSIKTELDTIKENMMTQEDFKEFSRSQFWQKVLTFFGGVGTAILTWFIIHELTRLLEN